MNTSALHLSPASLAGLTNLHTTARLSGLALLVSASVLLSACGPGKPDAAAEAGPGTTTTTTTTVVTTAPALPAASAQPPALVSPATSPAPSATSAKAKPHSSTVAHTNTSNTSSNASSNASVEARAAEPVAPRPIGQLGSITAIDAVKSDPEPTNGAGAVIGGLLGGVLGNQVGGGDGKKVATVLGAVGGAVAGNNVQKNRDRTVVGYRLHITLDSGQAQEIIVPNRGAWNNGDRVRVLNGVVHPA
jgi:outer membrane lipoprotein SlyB